MGKVKKKRKRSIKWSFGLYIPVCAILAFLGAYGIGIGTNYMQDWYEHKYMDRTYEPHKETYEIRMDEEGNTYYQMYETKRFESDKPMLRFGYRIVSWAQAVLIPAWVLLCVGVTGRIFYRRELEQSVNILMDASERISENCLDFQVEQPAKQNELGQLCRSFEDMRSALYHNNQEMWRMLEERRRLNAAFSHDLRTPVTVLKGYTDLLEKYVPDGKVSEEKLMEILGMMDGQITRLQAYTQKMSSLHKLEDLTPGCSAVAWSDFVNNCRGISSMLAGTLQVCFSQYSDKQWVQMDAELVLEVYENLVSNAVRYAERRLEISLVVEEDMLRITVSDDGRGFSEEALRKAADPFFRGEQEKKETPHFGLGLYVCKVICEKCGGELVIENVGNGKESEGIGSNLSGGRVTAVFSV